jgi:thioredoxin reductase
VGTDDAGLLIAASLREAGAEILAVVDEAPETPGRELNAAPLRDAGVPFFTSSRVLSAQGDGAVESVTVCRLDPNGAVVPGSQRHLDVDVVCVAGPRSPDSWLVAQARCMIHDAPSLGGRVPVHDRWMETTARGLYVCGDGAGVENGAISIETGRLTGLSAAAALGYVHLEARAQVSLARRRLGYLRRGRRGGLRRAAKSQLESEHREALR